MPGVASLHWAYQNHCQKIARSCVLALGLAKPLLENCWELRPCTGLTKNTARKLQGVASLSWDYQNHHKKIAKSCVLALDLQKPLPENWRGLRPCTGLIKTSARKSPRAVSLQQAYQDHLPGMAPLIQHPESCTPALGAACLHWAHQNHCQKIADSCVLALGLPKHCHKIADSCALALGAVCLYWAHQHHSEKIASNCVLALGLTKPLPGNWR